MEITIPRLLPAALVIDHPEVDEQHQEIFTRIELLKVACVDGGYSGISAFDDLLVFIGHHFATEERIAAQAGLEFSRHTKAHHDNLYVLSKALNEVRRGASDVYSFLRYLEYWFERHILEEDKPFAVLLKSHVQDGTGNP
ncbi:MAG: hemerythrin family protein [Rhodocyclaceae bacterium]